MLDTPRMVDTLTRGFPAAKAPSHLNIPSWPAVHLGRHFVRFSSLWRSKRRGGGEVDANPCDCCLHAISRCLAGMPVRGGADNSCVIFPPVATQKGAIMIYNLPWLLRSGIMFKSIALAVSILGGQLNMVCRWVYHVRWAGGEAQP